MDVAEAAERPNERRRLISRPRLERLLDESDARIALLAAPAGYGKTTLARQWLASVEGPAVWYQARPESSDVAALALGIRQAFAESVPFIDEHVNERLRTTADPDREAPVLAALLARDVARAPVETTLVIDDYQHIAARPAAESFVSAFVDLTVMPILITTRARPSWISAKHLLYGEVLELGRNVLAMTHEEAGAVLDRGAGKTRLTGLVALAEGWPAVIGLAALLPDPIEVSAQTVPEALHAYFAEELYQGLPPEFRWNIVRLSLAPSLAPGLAAALFGSGTEVLEESYGRGFLTKEGSGYELHPLLRQFLRDKLGEFPQADVNRAAATVGSWYLDHQHWDEAFALAAEFKLADLLVSLIEKGLDSMLSEGRLSTLDQWLQLGRRLRATNSAVRLGEVESAFRRGAWRDAEAKAIRLANDLANEHHLAARVLFRAGQIAQLDDRLDEALELLTRAHDRAQTESDLRRILWSRFVTLCDLEEPDDAWQALVAFEQLPPASIEDLLRARHGRLLWAIRWGGIHAELEGQIDALEIVSQVPDPLARTGFLQTFGTALGLAARYPEALEIGERQLLEATASSLEWVKPHGLELKGMAQLGLRDFEAALSTLRDAYSLATQQANLHSQMSSVTLTSRVFLARGEYERALRTLAADWERSASPGMEGDYLATQALVLSCCGERAEALRLADASAAITDQIDGRILRSFVRGIVSHQESSEDSPERVSHAFREARATGNLDACVVAYRAYPLLLTALEGLGRADVEALQRLVRATDPQLAEKAGFGPPLASSATRREPLTARELEVFELLRQGMTNREIARSLWIEESTVKVHVRHILQKLSARSRTEAAAMGTELARSRPRAEPAD
jgi:LuxR family maltose regulon positive regulatory protein